MSAAYIKSLIEKTNPEPYEQIIVLSQKMINAAFHNMWILADDKSPLRHVNQKNRAQEFIETDLGPPKVQLQVTTDDPELYYLLKMTKGSLKIYTTNDPNDQTAIEWQIKDWVFAFSVKIAQKSLAKNSPEYAKFKERAGLAESNFSLSQLFIDSSSSTKWSPDLSNFGDRQKDWNSLGNIAIAQFQTFIQKWLNSEATKGQNILGYAAHPDDSNFNEYAPSFPPTSITYHNYPWRDPSLNNFLEKNNDDKNAISYLMLGGFHNPPSQIGLPYTGTFVEENGLYCMSRKIFWESWLLKQLRQVIKMMAIVPDKPDHSYNPEHKPYPWKTGVRLHAGDSGSADSDYDIKITELPMGIVTGSSDWYCLGPEKNAETTVFGGGDQGIAKETVKNIGWISFGKGKETVHMAGFCVFNLYVAHGRDFDRWTNVKVKGSWSLTIGMVAVEDGGVEFKKVPRSDTVVIQELSHEGPLLWEHGVESVINAVKGALEQGLERGYSKVEKNLLNALSTQGKLFLPGAGTFLMKDPKFNDRGDLIVNLEYNGAEPPPRRRERRLAHAPPAEPPEPIRIDLAVSDASVRVVSDA